VTSITLSRDLYISIFKKTLFLLLVFSATTLFAQVEESTTSTKNSDFTFVPKNSVPNGRKFKRKIYRYEEKERLSYAWSPYPENIEASYRYTRPGTGGIYAANSAKTALAEVTYWKVDLNRRKLIKKRIHLEKVLDLTRKRIRKKLGVTREEITQNDYELPQAIGDWAIENGFDGIRFPSARNPKGWNIVGFKGL